MMKNSKLKFSEYMQNISSSKSFGKFVLIVYLINMPYFSCFRSKKHLVYLDTFSADKLGLGIVILPFAYALPCYSRPVETATH